MCDAPRLRVAFQNVAFCADPTWRCDQDAHQKTSMGLYLRERQAQVRATRWERLSPRTVRDCIPESRLAQYANFEYDEARELSYAPATMRFERLYDRFHRDEVEEPWMLQEIDDLLLGFLTYKDSDQEKDCAENHESLPCNNGYCEMSYESPFLDASNFEEMAIKLKISSLGLRRLWDIQFFPYFGWHPYTQTKTLELFKSPACQMFGSTLAEADRSDWLERSQDCGWSFSQVKDLTQSIKDQNTRLFRRQNSWLGTGQENRNISTHKRLYSAVLQGTANTRRSTSVQFPTTSSWNLSRTTDTGTETATGSPDISLQDYQRRSLEAYRSQATSSSYFQQRTSTQTPLFTGYQYLSPNTSSNFYPRPLLVPGAGLLNFRHTGYFPQLVLQNPASYTPTPFVGYGRPMLFPQRPPMMISPSNWFVQQSVKTSVGFLATRNPTTPTTYRYRQPVKPKEEPVLPDLENVVAKTVSAVLDDQEPFVPVTDSVSDDLELQALEQYSPSSDNVFSELERQAAEQYDTSENWIHPPKSDDKAFGGWCHLVTTLKCIRQISRLV